MLRRPEANSRFFTDCYLYPAALRSRPWPKWAGASLGRCRCGANSAAGTVEQDGGL